ncbi:MAG: thiamine-monophosphate kinase [Planctomycetaceae bacterium]|jgi:thiamine-monophosphate kinase|nr:thiamine-monophosphate kinase [Planctomycetaceae bacterium]
MESKFIDWLKVTLSEQTVASPGVGDDAAMFTTHGEMKQLITSDCLVDRVHFDVSSNRLDLIGRKCVGASISDIAAMCGIPTYVIISIVAPKSFTLDELKELYAGMHSISNKYNCSIIGGDFVSHDGPLTINVTVLGQARHDQVRFRFGTEADDLIFVSGTLGGSRLGRHLSFNPRVELGLILGDDPDVHAVTDITDGLVIDLHSILNSANFGATLIEADIPTSPQIIGPHTTVEAALYDGEDFELLFTASSSYVGHLNQLPDDVPITKIGYVTQEAEYLLLVDSGDTKSMDIRGYSH